MKTNKKRLLFLVLGVLLGASGGFLYWNHIGCTSEGCLIASNPVVATAYGALLLGLIADQIFQSSHKKNKQEI